MTLPSRVFCDASFLYACLDPADANRTRGSAVLAEASATGADFCTTWDVIGETVTLLRYRWSFRTALAFLDEVKPSLRLVAYGDRSVRRPSNSFAKTSAIAASRSATPFRSSWSRRSWITPRALPSTGMSAADSAVGAARTAHAIDPDSRRGPARWFPPTLALDPTTRLSSGTSASGCTDRSSTTSSVRRSDSATSASRAAQRSGPMAPICAPTS